AFEVSVVGGHVVGADKVIQTAARPANRGDNVVPRAEFGDVRPDGFNATKSFVTNHKVVVSGRCRAVLGGIDFSIGSVNSDAQDLHQDAAPVQHLVYRGLREFGQVDAVRFAGNHADSFHFISPIVDLRRGRRIRSSATDVSRPRCQVAYDAIRPAI